jgi:hypothetical protein
MRNRGGGIALGAPVITSPVVNQVVQRDGTGKAQVTITGVSNCLYTKVEAQFISVTGGTSVGWTTLAQSTAATVGKWSGTVQVTAGWYQLQVRTSFGSTVLGITSVDRMGVGEIFIIGGPSTVGNANGAYQNVNDARIVTPVFATGQWQMASDPQPNNPTANGGSPFVNFGNELCAHLNLPVAVIVLWFGGTHIAQWQPGYDGSSMSPTPEYRNPYGLLQHAVQYFPVNGFRAFLYGNGENDGASGTTTADYESGMQSLIAAARADAGWNFPVGISLQTYIADTTYPAITTAQNYVATNYAGCWLGPNMDSLTGTTYRKDGTHFNTVGENASGDLWYQNVVSHFGW